LMVLGDEGALDALLYPLAAGAQPHSALHSPVLRVARPTLCLSLLLSLCVLGAVLTGPLLLRHGELRARAAADIFGWRGVQPRCARLSRGWAHRIRLPSLPQVGVAFFARAGATYGAAAGRAAAAAGRLLAAPGAVRAARHGGSLLDPRVLGPRAPTLLARSGSAELGDRHSRVAPPRRDFAHMLVVPLVSAISCALCVMSDRELSHECWLYA
jgi:hypothetical protein